MNQVEETLLKAIWGEDVDTKSVFTDLIEAAKSIDSTDHSSRYRNLLLDEGFRDFLNAVGVPHAIVVNHLVREEHNNPRYSQEHHELAMTSIAWADGFALGISLIALIEKKMEDCQDGNCNS